MVVVVANGAGTTILLVFAWVAINIGAISLVTTYLVISNSSDVFRLEHRYKLHGAYAAMFIATLNSHEGRSEVIHDFGNVAINIVLNKSSSHRCPVLASALCWFCTSERCFVMSESLLVRVVNRAHNLVVTVWKVWDLLAMHSMSQISDEDKSLFLLLSMQLGICSNCPWLILLRMTCATV